MRVAKTEAMPGLSREEALRLAQAAVKPEAKTGEIKAAPADAKKTGSKVAIKKTGEIAAPQAEKAGAPKQDAKTAPERKAADKTALVATPAPGGADKDTQQAKTEVMSGMSRSEAERQAHLQVAKTEVMSGMSRAEAEARVAKAKQIEDLSRDEARRQAQAGTPAPPEREPEAETTRSPMPLILGVVAVAVVAVLFWKVPAWFGSSRSEPAGPTAAQKEPAAKPAPDKRGERGPAGPSAPPTAAGEKEIDDAVRALEAASDESIEME
jgi:hypothetical protein